MVKVAWKVINGYGPYAYLQERVKSGGKVTSNHIAYLGKADLGKDGVVVIPGKNFNAPAAGDFAGWRILIPPVGDEAQTQLKPKPKALVEFMEQKAKAGRPTNEINAQSSRPWSRPGVIRCSYGTPPLLHYIVDYRRDTYRRE